VEREHGVARQLVVARDLTEGLMKGKELSLGSKVFGAVFVLVAWMLNAIFRWQIATWDIIQVGLFFGLIFSPVDVSLWLEKFRREG
jgi:uncharacterized membrane protein